MERSIGMATGICFGLLVAVILIKLLNKDKKVKAEYDERQRQIRGRSYMFAFYSTVITEALMMLLSMGGFLKTLPVEEYVFHGASMFVGLMVLCIHSVWNGAYWGLNNNIKKYYITFIVLFIFNLMPFIGLIRGGLIIENGYIVNFPFLNCLVLIMYVVLGITLFARKRIDDENSDREECL